MTSWDDENGPLSHPLSDLSIEHALSAQVAGLAGLSGELSEEESTYYTDYSEYSDEEKVTKTQTEEKVTKTQTFSPAEASSVEARRKVEDKQRIADVHSAMKILNTDFLNILTDYDFFLSVLSALRVLVGFTKQQAQMRRLLTDLSITQRLSALAHPLRSMLCTDRIIALSADRNIQQCRVVVASNTEIIAFVLEYSRLCRNLCSPPVTQTNQDYFREERVSDTLLDIAKSVSDSVKNYSKKGSKNLLSLERLVLVQLQFIGNWVTNNISNQTRTWRWLRDSPNTSQLRTSSKSLKFIIPRQLFEGSLGLKSAASIGMILFNCIRENRSYCETIANDFDLLSTLLNAGYSSSSIQQWVLLIVEELLRLDCIPIAFSTLIKNVKTIENVDKDEDNMACIAALIPLMQTLLVLAEREGINGTMGVNMGGRITVNLSISIQRVLRCLVSRAGSQLPSPQRNAVDKDSSKNIEDKESSKNIELCHLAAAASDVALHLLAVLTGSTDRISKGDILERDNSRIRDILLHSSDDFQQILPTFIITHFLKSVPPLPMPSKAAGRTRKKLDLKEKACSDFLLQLRATALQVIGNCCYRHKGWQDAIRNCGGIECILNHTQLNQNFPTMRECMFYFVFNFDLFFIRNLVPNKF